MLKSAEEFQHFDEPIFMSGGQNAFCFTVTVLWIPNATFPIHQGFSLPRGPHSGMPLFFPFWLLFMLLSTATAAAESLQSCPTLCDPIDGSPPGSPVPGILQARTLEWVAISFSLSLVHLRSPSKDGIVVYLGCFYHK